MNELEIARYLDRGLSVSDRDRFENHLVGCASCRHDVVEAESLVHRIRRPRRVIAIGGVIGIAAAVLIGLNPTLFRRPAPLERAVQSSTEEPRLTVYGPVGQLASRPTRFVWGNAQGAVSYRLTLSNSNGIPVWTQSGTDTVATLPDSVSIGPAERYVWTTDALLGDGSTRSTGPREFEISK